MDRELYFVPEHGCYVIRWIAVITKAGATEHWRDLIEHPEFRPEFTALHDFRGATVRPDREEDAAVGEAYRRDIEPQVGFGRVAILVADAVSFERAERLTRLLELEGTLVSFSEQSAKEWIGLPGDFALPYPSPAG